MLYLLLIIHFIADFVLQTDQMAVNKSKSNGWLLFHVLTYGLCFLGVLGIKLALVNAIAHFITDYISSRVGAYLWAKQERKKFFIVIGADQLAHTLVLVYLSSYV